MLKLPRSFFITTPFGNYNPDWAIVFCEGKFRYVNFVAETKGNSDEEDLRGIENFKISCAKKHFKSIGGNVGYEVVENIDDLKNKIKR